MKVTSQIRSRMFDVDVLTGEARLRLARLDRSQDDRHPCRSRLQAVRRPQLSRTMGIVLGIIIHVLVLLLAGLGLVVRVST